MKVLVCENDEALLDIIEFTFVRNPDVMVHKALDGIQAINLLKKVHYDLIVIAIPLPHYSGVNLIHYVREHQQLDTPIIVISDDTRESTMMDAKRLGIEEYIFKPFSPLELLESINACI